MLWAPTVEVLLGWYREGARDLPWRRTTDPYSILVSEIMLQQTQVSRVVPRYTAWVARWPTAQSLAEAPLAEVITAWSGLGYNRRAVNLQRACVVVARDGWPSTVSGLRRLPGVGPYTAAALGSLAFALDVVPVDVNIQRIADRAFGGQVPAPPAGRAAELTQALFDLGATVCVARRPRCLVCPLADDCPSRGTVYAPSRKQPPFAGSRRQARGTLVRELTAGPIELAALDGDLVDDLVRDGLVAVRDGVVMLP